MLHKVDVNKIHSTPHWTFVMWTHFQRDHPEPLDIDLNFQVFSFKPIFSLLDVEFAPGQNVYWIQLAEPYEKSRDLSYIYRHKQLFVYFT